MGYNRTYGDIGAHPHSHTGNKEAYGAVLLPSTDPLLQQWLNTEKVPFVRQLLLFPTKQVSNEWPARASKWSCAILPTQQCRKACENRQEIGSRFMERVGKRAQAASPIAVCLAFCLQRCQDLTRCMGRNELLIMLADWSGAHSVLLVVDVPRWHE